MSITLALYMYFAGVWWRMVGSMKRQDRTFYNCRYSTASTYRPPRNYHQFCILQFLADLSVIQFPRDHLFVA